jgi:cytochrome c-type biogenesis protein CcmE
MSKGLQIALGGVMVAVLLGWYAATNLEEIGTFEYFQTLEEFRSADVGQAARVHGFVAIGSIERDMGARSIRFAVVQDPPHAAPAGSRAQDTLPVVYGTLDAPDMFKDGAEVVVEGRMGAGAVFLADNVMAKCPSKFEAKQAELEAKQAEPASY